MPVLRCMLGEGREGRRFWLIIIKNWGSKFQIIVH